MNEAMTLALFVLSSCGIIQESERGLGSESAPALQSGPGVPDFFLPVLEGNGSMSEDLLNVGDRVICGWHLYKVVEVDRRGFCILMDRKGTTIIRHRSGLCSDDYSIAQTLMLVESARRLLPKIF
jgi:hypothetical protein